MKDITLFHSEGVAYFNSKEILTYGSLEALTASEILQGVPNREKSLTQLWEAAQSLAAQSEETQTETEETEKEG